MMMAARVVVMAAAIVHDSRWHIGSAFDWYGTRGPCGHPTRPGLLLPASVDPAVVFGLGVAAHVSGPP